MIDQISLVRSRFQGVDQMNVPSKFFFFCNRETFGFNEGFIKIIRALYNNVQNILKINGGLSVNFRGNRGVRQGCSLSGIFCNSWNFIAIEPLLQKLRF